MPQNNISSFVRPLSWQKSYSVIIYHDIFSRHPSGEKPCLVKTAISLRILFLELSFVQTQLIHWSHSVRDPFSYFIYRPLNLHLISQLAEYQLDDLCVYR